ncbi:MAG: TRAP transporter substrate-binding protein, partial [Bacteroidota bacterium]
HLTSNRPIRHPSELKGIILRTPNVPAYITAWEALGAKPTPMAFSEVFTSLQQGTIEAQENPFAMIRSAGFNEVQDYLNLTGHLISWGYIVVGEKQFQALPKDLKEIFLQAARDMQSYEHKIFLKKEKLIKTELAEKGMEFIEVDKAAFSEISSRALFEGLSPDMQKIYQEISALNP